MSAGSSSPKPGPNKLSVHSGTGTLRGGGMKKVYGNMASFKQYKHKIDYRLPLVTIVCISCIAALLFIYGLYQLKGHDTLVEYITNTRDLAKFLNRHKRQEDEFGPLMKPSQEVFDSNENSPEKTKDEEKKQILSVISKTKTNSTTVMSMTTIMPSTTLTEILMVESTTSAMTTTTNDNISEVVVAPVIPLTEMPETEVDKNVLTINELDEMHDQLVRTYSAVWKLFAANLIVLLFLIPATVLYHFDFFQINKFKTIFRFVLILTMFFLIIQFLYLVSPVLTSSCSFPEHIDRLFADETTPKHDRGIAEIQEEFSCDFKTTPELIERGIQDPCIPKIKDSLFPCYATVFLIFLDVLPFIFALFTYAWDAWIKDCTAVREARMRVELNNQRRPQTREQILEQAMINRHPGPSNGQFIR